MTRKGQAVIGTILVVTLATVFGVTQIDQIQGLLEVILSNILYTSMATVAVIAMGVVAILAYRGQLESNQAFALIVLIFGFIILIPVLGQTLASFTTTYSIPVTVTVTDPAFSDDPVSFDQVQVGDPQEEGPLTFSTSPGTACTFPAITGCSPSTWSVQVEGYCNGESFGTIDITGSGTATAKQGMLSEAPPGSQCHIEAEMTSPQNHRGIQGTKTVSFQTPQG